MISKLISWSNREFNTLPWRKHRTLYGTLVSEIMLQQTTVSTVLNHFERFLAEYPAPRDVALATEEELTISWKGLGYYRRARNLKKACETICNEYAGVIPLDYEKLIAIPGIGDYTASAILAIGNDEPVLALDANLERVIARLYELKTIKGPKLLKEIKEKFLKNELAQDIYKTGGRDFNEALMDLGRNYCQARKATCELCPLRGMCKSYKNNSVSDIPNIVVKEKEKFNLKLLRIVVEDDGKYLVYKKSKSEWLSGQYELPTFVLATDDESLKQYPYLKDYQAQEHLDLLDEYKTAITKYTIVNKVLRCDLCEFQKLNLKIDDFEWGNRNLSTASMKAINL